VAAAYDALEALMKARLIGVHMVHNHENDMPPKPDLVGISAQTCGVSCTFVQVQAVVRVAGNGLGVGPFTFAADARHAIAWVAAAR
jgi:hypothetical protein